MKLSRAFIASVDRYIHSRKSGGLCEVNGLAVVNNNISVIIFTPDGDGEHIEATDFTGIEVHMYPNFKDSIWKYVIAPYWDDRTWNYKPMPTTIFLDDIKKDVNDVHDEHNIPARTKLYDESITNGRTDVALKYGGKDGIWLNPELLYDIAKIISSKGKPIDIWIPNNKRQPAVVVGENKYGRHLGFVLGVMKNFKEN